MALKRRKAESQREAAVSFPMHSVVVFYYMDRILISKSQAEYAELLHNRASEAKVNKDEARKRRQSSMRQPTH